MLYLTAGGILAEKAIGSGGTVTWNNYLFVAGKMVGMRVESGGAVQTRYFHRDHLGSVAILTDEAGTVVERLSYDAWGKRRQANGQDDPAGALTSQTTRGFTGHEQLADVGLVHMNGRVYDPMLGRFGTPDPMTENPFSTQGWNRYSYVGNSPLNFTDPSGYCFMGCFWQKPFKALGALLRRVPIIGQILTVAAGLICGPVCSSITSAVVTGLASGDLGLALKAGLISMATAAAFTAVGDMTGAFPGTLDKELLGHGPLEFMSEAHVFNIAGHAAVGCGSAVASGGKCGPGALSGAIGSFAGPMFHGLKSEAKLIATATVGGLASVAGGGKFGNGAVTAAFGYLYNEACGGGNCYGAMQRQWEDVTNAVVVGFQDAIAELGEYYGYVGTALGGGGAVRMGARVAIRYAEDGLQYADRVRQRGLEDPTSHNFPYSYDKVILGTKPIQKPNDYKIYQAPGTMNNRSGFFEIGVNKDGVIDHRFFRPDK